MVTIRSRLQQSLYIDSYLLFRGILNFIILYNYPLKNCKIDETYFTSYVGNQFLKNVMWISELPYYSAALTHIAFLITGMIFKSSLAVIYKEVVLHDDWARLVQHAAFLSLEMRKKIESTITFVACLSMVLVYLFGSGLVWLHIIPFMFTIELIWIRSYPTILIPELIDIDSVSTIDIKTIGMLARDHVVVKAVSRSADYHCPQKMSSSI